MEKIIYLITAGYTAYFLILVFSIFTFAVGLGYITSSLKKAAYSTHPEIPKAFTGMGTLFLIGLITFMGYAAYLVPGGVIVLFLNIFLSLVLIFTWREYGFKTAEFYAVLPTKDNRLMHIGARQTTFSQNPEVEAVVAAVLAVRRIELVRKQEQFNHQQRIQGLPTVDSTEEFARLLAGNGKLPKPTPSQIQHAVRIGKLDPSLAEYYLDKLGNYN